MTTTLTLPQAIRLGATLKPQHHDPYRFYVKKGPFTLFGRGLGTVCSCVMGAAADAIGLDTERVDGQYGWPPEWATFLTEPVTSPVSGLVDDGYTVILDLNDCYRWTREAIADWVDDVEHTRAAIRVASEGAIGGRIGQRTLNGLGETRSKIST